ncbi:protein FAM219A [Nilaparvata lugens]|uniref:protein FAM219A n=1 Tax=Nilaparvata lugens TaxID=108931 RepID=UPI000B994C4F|nr:protein FAM219A [Nilaparvata lugens]
MDDSGFDSDPKRQIIEDDQLFPVSDSSSSSAATINSTPRKSNRSRELQKKLERRIEQAKKIHSKQEAKKSPSLIPIQRLPIPGGRPLPNIKEQHPLVNWDSDESEELDFFPVSRTRDSKQELTDTFSIEDFELTPEEDDLDLRPPKTMNLCCNCRNYKFKCTIL